MMSTHPVTGIYLSVLSLYGVCVGGGGGVRGQPVSSTSQDNFT